MSDDQTVLLHINVIIYHVISSQSHDLILAKCTHWAFNTVSSSFVVAFSNRINQLIRLHSRWRVCSFCKCFSDVMKKPHATVSYIRRTESAMVRGGFQMRVAHQEQEEHFWPSCKTEREWEGTVQPEKKNNSIKNILLKDVCMKLSCSELCGNINMFFVVVAVDGQSSAVRYV